MSKALVLMTAMPPTKGHLALIEFASNLAGRVTVIVSTQPSEPFCRERYEAVRGSYVADNVDVVHLHRELPQDPETPGFWDIWYKIVGTKGFLNFPIGKGDFVVTSEPYGAKLAELTGATFMPYDPGRELLNIKATRIRESVMNHFDQMVPEFQKVLRKTVTVFGAESTGKTTLSKSLDVPGAPAHWAFEWARPYLETVGPEITVEKMHNIWHGQASIQRMMQNKTDKPFIVQDTDLFSTIGYWEQAHWTEALGPVPEGLIKEAFELKSDLYLITKSVIPFEPDEIRYGIDKRESPDEYWIALAQKYNLPYVVIEPADRGMRILQSRQAMNKLFNADADFLKYDRGGF